MSEITHKSLRPARVHLSARLKLIGISEKDAALECLSAILLDKLPEWLKAMDDEEIEAYLQEEED